MLIVISNPIAIKDEANIINTLFVEGLEVLHIRRPEASVNEIRRLIEKIDSKYYNQIALHQHHQLTRDFGIKRLHFTEAKRKEMSEEELITIRAADNILSTSIHQTEDYKTLPTSFEYTFFGPVFNSISKQGYTSAITHDFIWPVKKKQTKVFAIGGVDATNIQQAIKMQFDGAAVLGTIWQKPEESIQQFKALQKAWKQTDQLY